MRVTSTYYTILVLMLSSYPNFEYHISQKPLKCVREYFFLIIMNRGMQNFNSFKKRKNYSKRGNRKNIRRRKNMLIVKYYDAVVVFSYYIYVSVRILSCKMRIKTGKIEIIIHALYDIGSYLFWFEYYFAIVVFSYYIYFSLRIIGTDRLYWIMKSKFLCSFTDFSSFKESNKN